MDINAVYNEQAQIARAWVDFVSRGTIPENIRPIIIESWIRCKENGLNGWGSPYLEMRNTTGELGKRLQKRRWLLDACMAIMQYIAGTIDEVCFKLKDTDGYVLYVQDSVDSSKLWLHGVGLILNESKQGTIASDLAMRHQMYVDVNGFEHFFVCYHKFFRSAFPIRSIDGEIGGILELFANHYSTNTEIARNCMKIAAQIIEKCVIKEEYNFEKTPEFCDIIDFSHDAICCMDNNGDILNINQNMMKEWGIKERSDAIGASINNFLDINFNMLKMYPKSIRVMDAVDVTTGNMQRISISTIYRPRETETFLIRFSQRAMSIQEKGWAAYEKITVLDNNSEYDAHGMGSHSMGMIGSSLGINNIRKIINKIAPMPATVLIEGATGTGKELVAQAIHERSGVNGEFIIVNCGAIPAELLQSELFGYVSGAFSGADKKGRIGKLEAADNGTIFLDEIGEMPLDMQVSLLRFLQDYIVIPLGANVGKKINTRIIAATNRILEHEVRMGNFREDLYYRLNVIKIDIPPLVNRKEDIIPIAEYYLERFASKLNYNLKGFDQESSLILCSYSWPGNIRELKNMVERIVLFANKDDAYVTAEMLPEVLKNRIALNNEIYDLSFDKDNEENKMDRLQTQLIIETMERCGGNITKAADILGIHRTTLYRRLKKM